MPRKAASTADRIVADVLSLPPDEARLLIGFLATTLRLAGGAATPAAPKPRKPKVVVAEPATQAVVLVTHAAKAPWKPRLASAAVPAGAPGPSSPEMTVGED